MQLYAGVLSSVADMGRGITNKIVKEQRETEIQALIYLLRLSVDGSAAKRPPASSRRHSYFV